MMGSAVALGTVTAVGVAAAKSVTGSGVLDIIALIATTITALGIISRFLHVKERMEGQRALAKLVPFFEDFATDWKGTPARPGVPEVPSMPERVARTEARTEKLQHEFATETLGRLILIENQLDKLDAIAKSAVDNGDAIGALDTRITGLDTRVTGHRDRQNQAVQVMAEHLLERIESLRADVEAGRVDREKLEQAIAILTELGFYKPDDEAGGG
jgi:hypothetical protein